MKENSKNFEEKAPVRIVMVGHVDHGKSSIVGRLLHDTNSLPDGKVELIKTACEKRGMPFEWAFVMDALKSERDQGITIEVSQIHFKTEARQYVLLDAPGHKEFIKNMVTGAARADAAVLVVDAKDGVQEQTKRHAYLLHLLGINQVTIAVNKMDMVNYDENRFIEVSEQATNYLKSIGINEDEISVIPVSARNGDNIAKRSDKMNWYEGTLLTEALDLFKDRILPTEKPLIFPVQDVYKFDERRIVAGQLVSGRLYKGDEILFSPSGNKAKVSSIESWNSDEDVKVVSAEQAVGITLSEQIFVERGEIISHVNAAPMLTNVFQGNIFWLGKNPLTQGKKYKIKIHTAEHIIQIEKIEKVLDVEDLSSVSKDSIERHDVGEVIIRSRSQMVVNQGDRFVIQEDFQIVGGGLINMKEYPDQRKVVKSENIQQVEHKISLQARCKANHHKSGILWFTGLSASGKSTLAIALEKALFEKGLHVYALDGDNIRGGLCSDLGFSAEDRKENIRRAGEISHLFAGAGNIVISSFISPYQADRELIRNINPEIFHEVYIKASVETCAKRDPKKLYEKAKKGEIKNFTGISAPYEAPKSPDLIIDTEKLSVKESVEILLNHVLKNFVA